MIKYSGNSHIGQRKVNEDSYFIDETLGLYIVADGVGGLNKGEVASKIACETIYASLKSGHSLVESVELAHAKIIKESSEKEEFKGMASTVVAVVFKGNSYDVAWVGDSRIYLWDGELKLITRDHSYVELLFENGHITEEELNTHPDKNVISQALGINREKVRVATNKGTLEKGQVLLMATDGLFGVVEEKNIINQIKDITNIEELTRSLVTTAVELHGKDNITLLTLRSEIDSVNKKAVIKANVVRKFDTKTGQIIKQHNDEKTHQVKVSRVKAAQPKLMKESKVNNNNGLLKSILSLVIIIIIIAMYFKIKS